jgi:ABC-type multidrug transport system ATPase subunit
VVAILDETDSGLDIDALRIVAGGCNQLAGPDNATLLITHYQRLLDADHPDYVHVMAAGRILRSGGPELALELERVGYDWVDEELAALEAAEPRTPGGGLNGRPASLRDLGSGHGLAHPWLAQLPPPAVWRRCSSAAAPWRSRRSRLPR